MATVAAQRDALAPEKPRSSPATSQASSAVGSPESRPSAGLNGISSTESLGVMGTGSTATPSETSKPPSTAERPSMTKRLTRMFSTREGARPESSSITSPSAPSTPLPKQDPVSSNSSTPGPRPNPPARKQSSTDRARADKERPDRATPPPTKDKRPVASQRYVVAQEARGGHEHHLKSAKRQEKLSDMFRNVISGKKSAEHEGEQQLSLMSGWVDQLKRERDVLAADKRGGPNATASLVEKYGKCQEIVGRGAFGIVRISHKRSDTGEQLFAVKEFRRRPEENEKKYSKRLTAEFCISSSLRHPNVIHTLDLLQDSKGDYCEVMEFCAGGDLYTLVLAAGKLEVNEADCFFKQMMRGVEYMHEMGVAHRDLKPENLLLTTHGALKITDFGNGECFRMAWESETHMVTGLCGSAPYIAPEEYVDKEFDARAVDVWATGVIYMAMRTGRHLWRVAKKEDDEFYERYLEGRRDEEGYAPIESLHRVRPPLQIPPSIPFFLFSLSLDHPKPNKKKLTHPQQARCRNVIYSILDPNPGRRITASQVLKSEWGREIKLCTAGEEGI
jgi:protein-serine/threonine kinase